MQFAAIQVNIHRTSFARPRFFAFANSQRKLMFSKHRRTLSSTINITLLKRYLEKERERDRDLFMYKALLGSNLSICGLCYMIKQLD